ncbi:MAG: hypothetical protein JWL64_473 [Frankiales bacterium]|nr:hypothetical protein [Frankiales bacterium]
MPDNERPAPPTAATAFEELGRIVLSEHTMESVLQLVADLARKVVPGAAEVSVSLVSAGVAHTVVHTGALALQLDESQYEKGYGPCLDAAVGGEFLMISDARSEQRWPAYARSAVDYGSLSSIAVPLPVQHQVTAALNVYGREPGAFDPASVALSETFAAYAAVGVANMHLYENSRLLAEQLTTAMRSRAVIDQAKGILMAERRIPASEAFDLLVTLSQHSNRKLREVAQALVDNAATPAEKGLG